jgi:hypothetical protein
VLRLIVLLLAALVLWKLLQPDRVELGPGVLAAADPVQTAIDSAPVIRRDEYRITPLAEFQIRAKVLSRESYYSGREADLSPLDLALGWGRMSDEDILAGIDISQSGRWYRWRSETLPIPRREIQTHSGNMHLIPADEIVEETLDDIRQGQIVDLKGYLVRADTSDGWRWVSSLSRNDTGARSCELVYVERARIVY